MLEQINSLPLPERKSAIDDRNGKLDLGQRGSQMGGHVVRSLVVMGVVRGLRRQPDEICFEIGSHLPRGILLNQQRCGRVAAEDRQQALGQPLLLDPRFDPVGDLYETLRRVSKVSMIVDWRMGR